MQITIQRTLSASPATVKKKTFLRMTLDCSRIAKKIAMVRGIFVKRSQILPYLLRGVDFRLKDRKNL